MADGMDPREGRLAERKFEFAVAIVRLTNALPRPTVGRNIGNQLFRAGTSGPANYEEACAAESRADFVRKMQIVLKEMRESRF
jgi:four helix bundle protein